MEENPNIPEPTVFGEEVLDMMRERRLADASELGIDRLDLRALRRHFEGDRPRRYGHLCRTVAYALHATDEEKLRLALAATYGERLRKRAVLSSA